MTNDQATIEIAWSDGIAEEIIYKCPLPRVRGAHMRNTRTVVLVGMSTPSSSGTANVQKFIEAGMSAMPLEAGVCGMCVCVCLAMGLWPFGRLLC